VKTRKQQANVQDASKKTWMLREKFTKMLTTHNNTSINKDKWKGTNILLDGKRLNG